MEILIFGGIVLLTLYKFSYDASSIDQSTISLIALFGMSSYRLMPSYARIISSYQTYKYHIQPVKEYYEDSINLFDNKNLYTQ